MSPLVVAAATPHRSSTPESGPGGDGESDGEGGERDLRRGDSLASAAAPSPRDDSAGASRRSRAHTDTAELMMGAGGTTGAVALLSPHLQRRQQARRATAAASSLARSAVGGRGSSADATAAAGSGSRGESGADSHRPANYKPAIDVAEVAKRQAGFASFFASTRLGVPMPAIGGKDDRRRMASLPAPVNCVISGSTMLRLVYAAVLHVLSPAWSFPCGVRASRQLLMDYADLKTTWCEKVVTERRREFLREEAALAAQGVDVSDREMPDFARAINRSPSPLVVQVEGAAISLLHAALEGVALHNRLVRAVQTKMADAGGGSGGRGSITGRHGLKDEALMRMRDAALVDAANSVFVGVEGQTATGGV